LAPSAFSGLCFSPFPQTSSLLCFPFLDMVNQAVLSFFSGQGWNGIFYESFPVRGYSVFSERGGAFSIERYFFSCLPTMGINMLSRTSFFVELKSPPFPSIKRLWPFRGEGSLLANPPLRHPSCGSLPSTFLTETFG